MLNADSCLAPRLQRQFYASQHEDAPRCAFSRSEIPDVELGPTTEEVKDLIDELIRECVAHVQVDVNDVFLDRHRETKDFIRGLY